MTSLHERIVPKYLQMLADAQLQAAIAEAKLEALTEEMDVLRQENQRLTAEKEEEFTSRLVEDETPD